MSVNKLDFVGFGALNVDLFYSLKDGRMLEQISPELHPGGEITGDESERQQFLESVNKHATLTGRSGGGQAANTAVALSRMGFRCGFLGKVGDDEIGELLLESLGEVDKSQVQRGENSGMCLCILDQKGERANTVFPGCNDTITLRDSDADYARNSKVLHLTSFCSEKVLKQQEWLLDKDMGNTIITFDPGEIYSRLGLGRIRKVLESTCILFATAEELNLMTGKEVRKAAEDILQCGTHIVVCKRAEQGSEIISEAGNISIPVARAKKVVDKTGAGDVYAAGFIAGILLKLSMELCGKLASEAAALSISAYGRENYPDSSFLKGFLERMGER